ncbi:hypothetical protein L6164_019097 [Bauhinia variegata]|uniref:Uncharacterized protein n=1 Tax=Bauhinia variegata TaxID=167791 RepID=A0ACB9NF96_BAUVA|nr:hypothetical protein L6164_019097 [Bauhinia variegata]
MNGETRRRDRGDPRRSKEPKNGLDGCLTSHFHLGRMKRTKRVYGCIDLYFVTQDGSTFKSKYRLDKSKRSILVNGVLEKPSGVMDHTSQARSTVGSNFRRHEVALTQYYWHTFAHGRHSYNLSEVTITEVLFRESSKKLAADPMRFGSR